MATTVTQPQISTAPPSQPGRQIDWVQMAWFAALILVGYFSILASALVGPQGSVFSFEPDVTNFAHLVEHIEANNATNIRPMHMAVGAMPAVAEFFVNADNDGGHALWEVGRHPFNERTRQAPPFR